MYLLATSLLRWTLSKTYALSKDTYSKYMVIPSGGIRAQVGQVHRQCLPIRGNLPCHAPIVAAYLRQWLAASGLLDVPQPWPQKRRAARSGSEAGDRAVLLLSRTYAVR